MFKVLTNGCEPTKGTKHSACIDLYASEDVTIGAGETKLVGLGVAIDLDTLRNNFAANECLNYAYGDEERVYKQSLDIFDRKFLNSHYLQLMIRSSLSKELIIANGVGIVDLDYKDEIKIRLHKPLNLLDVMLKVFSFGMLSRFKEIKKGDKIAQITLVEHKSYLFGIESDVERDGGFGSTGA